MQVIPLVKATSEQPPNAETSSFQASKAVSQPSTRLQSQISSKSVNLLAYNSLKNSTKTIFLNEGIGGFYKGMSAALVASAGSWGGYFYFYELSKQRKISNLQLKRVEGEEEEESKSVRQKERELIGREELGPVDHVKQNQTKKRISPQDQQR